VAIICYALPNTKPIFDRWRKLFTALLLVCPICGLLMGGGQLASTLLLIASHEGEGGAFFTIVAMLVSVVPVFFIPTILRSSMMAMGNLGARISQLGRDLGGGITRGIRSSEIGQDIQRRTNKRYFDRAAAKIEKLAAKRGGLDKLSDRQRRQLRRYNTSYNRLEYENVRAGGGTEHMKPGTALYESMMENVRSEEFDRDVTGRQNVIKSGNFDSIASPGSKVNGNDDKALSGELDEYLQGIVVPGNLSEAQVEEYVRNAQAIVNTLSDRGTSGARTKVMDSLSRVISENRDKLKGVSGSEKSRLVRTLGALAARISSKYGKIYKGDLPGSAAMLNDIANGDFSKADTFERVQDYDIDGKEAGAHWRSTAYTSSGLDGLNEDSYSKLKTSGLSSIYDGIIDGDVTGGRLQEVARLTDRVLSSDIYTPEGGARQYMERIIDAAYASGAHGDGGRTQGSMVIGRSSANAANHILDQIQRAGTWDSLGDSQDYYSRLISNVQDALAHDGATMQGANELREALRIAQEKQFPGIQADLIRGGTEMPDEGVVQRVPHGDRPLVETPSDTTNTRTMRRELPFGVRKDERGRWVHQEGSHIRPLDADEMREVEEILANNRRADMEDSSNGLILP